MTTFLVAHGAWSAGWAWKKMHPLMAGRGHRLLTPTYTGLGERAHHASPDVDLDTHIADMLGVIEMEDLNGFILIGHSYGGMVATGVAARARGRIAKLVYLDAFAPRDGDSVFSLTPDREQAVRAQLAKDGDGWRITPNPLPPDTAAADQAWAMPRRLPQPFKTFEQKLTLPGGGKIPFMTMLRASQNYILAAAKGMTIFELPPYKTIYDREQWKPLLSWLSSDRSIA